MSALSPRARDLFARARAEGAPSAARRARVLENVENAIAAPSAHPPLAHPPVIGRMLLALTVLGAIGLVSWSSIALSRHDAVAEDAVSDDAVAAVSVDAVSVAAVSVAAVSVDAVSDDAVSDDAVSVAAVSDDAVSDDAVSDDAVSPSATPSSARSASLPAVSDRREPDVSAPAALHAPAALVATHGMETPRAARPFVAAAPPRAERPDGRDLAAELALLRAALRARRTGDVAAALDALDAHEARFPLGVLANERDVTRAAVICESGDLERGRALAAPFASSAWGGALARACEPSLIASAPTTTTP